MSRAVLSVIALVVFCAAGRAADAVDDIITLAQRGIGDDVLLAKVETGTNPALTTQDILRLKDGRVSDRVIAAMIRRGSSASVAPALNSVNYTASNVSDPVIGTPERVAAAPVTRVIEVQRSAPVYSTPVVYSQPVVYSSPVVYAGYRYPSYVGYYGGYYGRPYYSSYCAPRYYGGYYGGHYHRGHYHGRGGFGIRAGFRF